MKRLLLTLTTLVLCVALAGCRAGDTFEGSKISEADRFQMEYSALNRQEEGSLALTAGDAIMVSIAHEAGTVDVVVGVDEKEPIYEGNGLTNASFTLNVSESGTYRIDVTGHDARGAVSFTKAAESETEAAESETKVEAEESETEAERQTVPDQSAAYATYQLVLQQIVFENIYPDGTYVGFDGDRSEYDRFAVFDVNGDGIDELIVQITTASMAENAETVYAYHESDNTVETLLSVFPAVTYYDNGFVKAELSHASGLEGEDYWPYSLYRYCADTDAYEMIAEAAMWSKAAADADYAGNPYPEDIDTENAGTVFILTCDGTTETVSKSDYEARLFEVMGDAQPISIPYQSLNEENIRAVYEG